MPRIIFCSAPSWALFLEKRDEWIAKASGPTLFLIPQNWQSNQIRQSFPDSPAFTTPELLERYLSSKFGKKQLLSKQSVQHLLLSIIFETSTEEKLAATKYLNIQTYYQGYARALNEFILDFRESGQQNLLEALNAFKSSALSAKERDLIDINDELENILHQRNLFDYRRAVFDFLEDKDKGRPEFFLPELPNATLIVFGYNHFTFLESKLIGWLMYRFKQSIFTYCKNSNAAETTFKCQISLKTFIEKARQVFKESINEIDISQPANYSLLPVAELLFHDDKRGRLLEHSGNINIFQVNDRFSEVTLIARQIRHLNEKGVPYKHIRTVFPNYEVYASLLREVFPRYKIPYKMMTGTPLAFYPLTQLVSNIINQAVVPSPFALREHIFSSPYITFSFEVTADALRKFVTGIADELSGIYDIIDEFLYEPKSYTLNFLWLQAMQKKASQAIRSAEKLHPLQLIVRYFNRLYVDNSQIRNRKIFRIAINYYLLSCAEKALYVWRNEMEPAAFGEAVEGLLLCFQIEKNINANNINTDNTIKAVTEQDKLVLTTLRKLIKQLEQRFSALMSHPGQKFPFTDLARAFASLLSDSQYYLPDTQTDGVVVLSPASASLNFWPVTFIAGLIDGEFPAQESFNFLQPKTEGQALSEALGNVDRDRQAFYQLIATTTDQCYVYYPISDSGKKLLVSPYVTEIQKCFSQKIVQTATDNDKCYTNREKLTYLGQHIDRSFDRALPLLKEFKQSSPNFFDQIIAIFLCDGLRGSIKNFSQFDGLFHTQPVIAAIKEQVHDQFVFDVEKLERFAGCPLRFLFDDLIHLKPEFLIDYHPDRTERGVVLKKILTEYSRETASAGKIPENADNILLQSASSAIKEILNEKESLFSHRFKNGLTMGLGKTDARSSKRPGLLAAFLKHEENAEDMLGPYLANISFENQENSTHGFQLNNIPIDIKIERVDITSDGRFLFIYNYSISDLGNVDKIGKGLSFKLPLQIIALRQYLAQHNRQPAVAGAGTYLVKNYRNIKRGGYFALKDLQATRKDKIEEATPVYSGQREYGFLPAGNFEPELKVIAGRILQIKNLIHRGRFHLPICTVKDQTCANCFFARICRKDQLRLDRLYTQADDLDVYKPRRRLGALD